ncbi:translation initiation factor IF-2-like [Bubalus bubalis]|uniref:translation initiation factor IF-2-like n=1 Tax=Bubalus bubalis TaxID=89462 RepID=UPI00042CA58C|nr:translation initiation factor IF-2-like [Bubalus bubalis]
MAGLVAADRRGGTRGGRSFAQVRSLRRGAGQAGRVGCAPCPAPGHRWETSLERSLPGDSAPPTPRALTPAAWAPPRRPRAPRSRSPRPRLPPPPAASGSGPGRRSGSEHFPRRPLPTGCDSPLPWHPRFARAPVARLTMKPRACAVVGRGGGVPSQDLPLSPEKVLQWESLGKLVQPEPMASWGDSPHSCSRTVKVRAGPGHNGHWALAGQTQG